MVKRFRIKNWEKFQQYKDRDPKWIKLHRDLLDDYEFDQLSEIQQVHLLKIWLLAAKLHNDLPYDPVWIAKKIGAKSKVDLNQLCTVGFIVPYSSVQDCTECYLEKETETETETEEEGEREARASSPPSPSPISKKEIAISILDHLNYKAGTKFKPVNSNIDLIIARLNEGHDQDELLAMIDRKCYEWLGDPKTKGWLRPKTLFNATNCSNYIGQETLPSEKDLRIHEQESRPKSWEEETIDHLLGNTYPPEVHEPDEGDVVADVVPLWRTVEQAMERSENQGDRAAGVGEEAGEVRAGDDKGGV